MARVIVKCANPECGEEFSARPIDLKHGKSKFCSRACSSKNRFTWDIVKTTTDVKRFFHAYPFATNGECANVLGVDIVHVNRVKRIIRAEDIERYKREWKR